MKNMSMRIVLQEPLYRAGGVVADVKPHPYAGVSKQAVTPRTHEERNVLIRTVVVDAQGIGVDQIDLPAR